MKTVLFRFLSHNKTLRGEATVKTLRFFREIEKGEWGRNGREKDKKSEMKKR